MLGVCRTPTLPALFVFGKSEIDANDCLECLSRCLSTGKRPFLVWIEIIHFYNWCVMVARV